jgi:hypothetical protein
MLQTDPSASSPAEEERHKLVLDELAQGQPTLLETDPLRKCRPLRTWCDIS